MVARYTPTIGLEIHAELKTKTKMFCGCRNAPHEEVPNTHICPVCMGHPGTLPTANKEAVRKVLLVGRALEARIATYSEFDRKHYFYPDIPKGYQISQYAYPFVSGGSLAGVTITRVHLEEDTARSLHDKGAGSLIDFNRAGVPLMELVTEPVIHDAKTASLFARELQLLLRTLEVSDANMEKGEMRVEVNISMSDSGTMGTKVEIKNLNSFRSVEAAIAHEIDRQVNMLEKGGLIVQETRGWDEIKEVTISQRKKESSHDYRYFPDPDLPKLDIESLHEFSESRLDELIPETPSKIRIKLHDLGLTSDTIETFVYNRDLRKFYERSLSELESLRGGIASDDRQKVANYITTDILGYLSQGAVPLSLENASPVRFAKLMHLLIGGAINSRVAKDLIPESLFGREDPEKVAKERGLLQQSGEGELLPIVEKILSEYELVVAEYKAGKDSSLQFLIGKSMKATQGAANPAVLKELLIRKINTSA
ncbi:Asp-tRNA(Asn)/Glu-tRNA(Gln) amidotransferase subunit GatB [Candidatus Kaiserbacteria bacterium]|nr:Asp-tRNA(Asn)/Glu-tRNA(Gln) amidotransferase subunit GatB [Candidatus Kaiserbacteria bacterium]